jgi:hypothetical protein
MGLQLLEMRWLVPDPPGRYGEQMTDDRGVMQTPGSNELFWYTFSEHQSNFVFVFLSRSCFPTNLKALGSSVIAESLNQG